MPKLIAFSCFMLFWVFYEISGGSDFAPRERVVVSQSPFSQSTRSKAANPVKYHADVVISAAYEPIVTTPLDIDKPEENAPHMPEGTVINVAAAAQAPLVYELHIVDANRVNLREGPSTTHRILETVSRGSAAEVISLNGDGWAQIRLTSSGQMGWMATRLLSEG